MCSREADLEKVGGFFRLGSALRRLGFLDEDFNTDVPEAMFLFLNLAENKKPLRKCGMLPCPGDNHLDVDRKLRCAFLYHATPETWQFKSSKMNPCCKS